MRIGPYIIVVGGVVQLIALAGLVAGEHDWQYWHALGWAAFLAGAIVNAIED